MKKALVVGNWKLYIKDRDEAVALGKKLARKLKGSRAVTIVCPPLSFIEGVSRALGNAKIHVGAQDVSASAEEKRTGEVSAAMLRSLGVAAVIVGHSERRLAGESDEVIAQKIVRALEAHLSPILCVGESVRDQSGSHFAVIEGQLSSALKGVTKRDASRLIIAYEPVWAIGKSAEDAMKPAELEESAIFIRKALASYFGRSVALKIPVLYGGSVEPENAHALFAEGGVMGFLVGHASTDADSFAAIAKAL